MSGIRLHRKFTEKMAIHDHYMTGLDNRQRKGKDEPKRRLFHNLSGIRFPGRTRQNSTITSITGLILNYLLMLICRLKTLIKNPKGDCCCLECDLELREQVKRPRSELKNKLLLKNAVKRIR